jgi:two-component system, sensor histidine kinase PdtaS
MVTSDSAAAATVEAAAAHLANVADNLQLVADLSYADVALAVPEPNGELVVRADARPSTAMAPFAASRAGCRLAAEEEPEAYAALRGRAAESDGPRPASDPKFSVTAFPIGRPTSCGVVVCSLAEQVAASPGRMERAFAASARELLDALGSGPLRDLRTGAWFSTTRRAGDGVLRVNDKGRIAYASPNAVTIMRLAGVEGRVTGLRAATLPGGGFGISPVLGTRGAIAIEAETADRVLSYRSIALASGALVLVEDLTEARRREQQLRVKEATIREVHHRVKNNLQTIASLLRIQARRSESEETRRALAEATERVASMAVVHDLLAHSNEEQVDLTAVVAKVAELVRHGLVGQEPRISVVVSGSSGDVDARTATSLALAVAELVHNAFEHAFEPGARGVIEVGLRRGTGELELTVGDDGRGLPAGLVPGDSQSLGMAIVRTVVEDDLHGTLAWSKGRGTTVKIRVPLPDTT